MLQVTSKKCDTCVAEEISGVKEDDLQESNSNDNGLRNKYIVLDMNV